MTRRSGRSWLRSSRWNRGAGFSEPDEQRFFHPLIEKQGGGDGDCRVKGYGGIRVEEKTEMQIDCGDPPKNNHMEKVDGIRSVTQEENERVMEEERAGAVFFEENAAGDYEGGGAAPQKSMEVSNGRGW